MVKIGTTEFFGTFLKNEGKNNFFATNSRNWYFLTAFEYKKLHSCVYIIKEWKSLSLSLSRREREREEREHTCSISTVFEMS